MQGDLCLLCSGPGCTDLSGVQLDSRDCLLIYRTIQNTTIAEGFNDFLFNVRHMLSCYIPESNFTFETYLNESMNENFVFANITPDIIFEKVNKLKPRTAQEKTIF